MASFTVRRSRLIGRFGVTVAILVPMIYALSACGSAPSDTRSTTVVSGQATTLDLGHGADLIIPPGAMTVGAVVSAKFGKGPSGTWDWVKPLTAPVELISNPPNAIHGLLTLEFPAPTPPQGVNPANLYNISTYNPATRAWTPYASQYDQARHMIVALIPHFSWWDPTTWDWTGIGARINQDVGEAVGRRASAPTCTSAPPAWVNILAGVTADPAVAVRACAQAQGNILDVEMVNNRPYGMVMQYGSTVKWGWHETGSSAKDIALNKLADALLGPNQLYLPPLGRASVGIFETSGTSLPKFKIGPTAASLYVDFVSYVADYLLGKIPVVGDCVEYLADFVTDMSPMAVRDNIVNSGECLLSSYKSEVASGALDQASVDQLASTLSGLESATLVGNLWQVYGAEWQFLDLFVDSVLVSDNSGLGAGFSVLAHYTYTPPPTPPQNPPPTPVTPVPAPPAPVTPVPAPPTPVTPVPSQPVDAYSNYGQSNLWGHSMCRGNPAVPLSMPGGVGTQTFTVPSGVASLASAKIQIDPAPVTAQLTVAVNGQVEANTSAAAVGDTYFNFSPITVHRGDTITLTITFSATSGKIITLYTVGNPGGVFTSRNSCPDGASNDTVTNGGLRAVVSGMS